MEPYKKMKDDWDDGRYSQAWDIVCQGILFGIFLMVLIIVGCVVISADQKAMIQYADQCGDHCVAENSVAAPVSNISYGVYGLCEPGYYPASCSRSVYNSPAQITENCNKDGNEMTCNLIGCIKCVPDGG